MRLTIGAALGVAVCAAAGWPSTAHAQGSVRGQLTLVEREGAPRGDVAGGVVYLEPALARTGLPVPRATVPLGAEIAMRGREFVPHVRLVLAGGSIAFPNDDPFSHNVFSNTATNAFDLGLYRHGASRTVRFAQPGIYPIYCNIHHRMVSFAVAVPNEYAAVVGGDGRFAIPDVPAGSYVLHVWHERAGETTRPLSVGTEGTPDLRIALDARGYVPTPHANKFGLPYAATRADRY